MSGQLLGRSKELGRLRSFLDRKDPQFVLVSGIRGGGKSTLVRHAMADHPSLLHVCPPLPDPAQRTMLAHRIRALEPADGVDPSPTRPNAWIADDDSDLPADATWNDIVDALLGKLASSARPFVLVLDDAHRLTEARSRYFDPFLAGAVRAASEGVGLHVVFVGPVGALPVVSTADGPADVGSGPNGVRTERIRVDPLPFRAVAPLLPGRSAQGRARAYGVFGGIPRVLGMLDNSVTVGTNVRRLLLNPDGPLAQAGSAWLERDVQAPARYYAIMRTLARGEADWGAVHAGVSDLTRSGQVAPYLKRLGELGLVDARRSIDASPGSRSTRYAITDPLLAFWFRFVLPYRIGPIGTPASAPRKPDGAGSGRPPDGLREYYARAIRPRIDEHMETVLPIVCRQHLTSDSIETLGAVSREGGSLWGTGYDIPVAGMLTSGAAYYGDCRWTHGEERPSPLQTIEHGMRETRYGFGRERRLRLVFVGRPAPAALRRAVARTQDAELIDAEVLAG